MFVLAVIHVMRYWRFLKSFPIKASFLTESPHKDGKMCVCKVKATSRSIAATIEAPQLLFKWHFGAAQTET